jgi:hypothetical protein
MPAPVYSTQFIAYTGPASTPSYIVPVGFRAVVRCIDVVLQPTGGTILSAFVDGVGFWHVPVGFEPGFTYWSWRGRQVCTEPGAVDFTLGDAGSVVVSGYLLSLP